MRTKQTESALESLRLRLAAADRPLPHRLRELSYMTYQAGPHMDPHQHEGIEIIGCFSGRILMEISEMSGTEGIVRPRTEVVRGGSLIVFRSEFRHRARMLSPPYGRWLVHTDHVRLPGALEDLRSPAICSLHTLHPQMRLAFQLEFQRLFAALQSGDVTAGERASERLSALFGLVNDIVSTRSAGDALDRPFASDAVSNVIRAIHRSLRHGVSVRALADRVGYSPGHLERLFRHEMGLSISQYVAMQRLELAGRLWVVYGGRLRINEIAAAVGFASDTYFSRYFRRHTGLSPSEYRDALRR